ncbi:hypothetical protein F4777DRAFT_566326 [Nemania sp. FL0916]|nr:hypothetical protein F4777DRAFT_566326 [Nemania sp. FL0916]
MKLSSFISSLSFFIAMKFAYVFPSEHQAPLIRPPLSEAPDQRHIVLRSSSKSISGSYPLYDLLSISTQSGSISVSVTPHSASSESPTQPASLELKSHSGSVHATFLEPFAEHHVGSHGTAWKSLPLHLSTSGTGDNLDSTKYDARDGWDSNLKPSDNDGSGNIAQQYGMPAREYITSVSTWSASISGSFPLGSRTSLDSHSGSIGGVELVVVPINTSGPRKLRTVSVDGMQSIRIVDYDYRAASKTAWWKGMVSEHRSQSGSINVEYPDSWEGTIEVEAQSGSISVVGRGVVILREEQGRVFAQKGSGIGGKVVARARSGSVSLRFG